MLLLRSKLYWGGSPMFSPVCVTFSSEDAAKKFVQTHSFSSQQAIIDPKCGQDVICKTRQAYQAAIRKGTVTPHWDSEDPYLSRQN